MLSKLSMQGAAAGSSEAQGQGKAAQPGADAEDDDWGGFVG